MKLTYNRNASGMLLQLVWSCLEAGDAERVWLPEGYLPPGARADMDDDWLREFAGFLMMPDLHCDIIYNRRVWLLEPNSIEWYAGQISDLGGFQAGMRMRLSHYDFAQRRLIRTGVSIPVHTPRYIIEMPGILRVIVGHVWFWFHAR